MGSWLRPRRMLLGAGLGLGYLGWMALGRLREADITGEVALVTGGSRGLGLLLARELGRAGCNLAICARDEQELERARADLAARGHRVLARVCDVSDRQQVERLIEAVTREYGRIDILVNNAGVIQSGPVHAMTLADFEQAMAVMFWGVVYPTLTVLPEMRRRQRGRLVNITSIGGKVGVPHLAPYTSAKYAALGFSETLRAELARDGISVTTVVPGLMRTGSVLNAFFKGQREREFSVFSVLASLPLVSIDAERAARQIVRATRRGEAEVFLSLPAIVGARLYGLVPGLGADVFGLANRVLPSADDTTAERGAEIYERVRSPVLDGAIGWSLSAARRFNESS